MLFTIGFSRSRVILRVASVAVIAGFAAGCSSDTLRFTENPFNNPFNGAPTASAAPEQVAIPTQPVRTRNLAPVTTIAAQPLPAVGSVKSQPLAPISSSDLGEPIASTGSIPSTVVATTAPPGRIFTTPRGYWSAQNGASVVAQPGDTANSLASRYGVPAGAIIAVNGLSGPQLSPGSTIRIPTFSTGAAPATVSTPVRTVATAPLDDELEPRPIKTARVAPAPQKIAAEATTTHTVKPGETLGGIAARYGTSRATLAAANGMDEWAQVKIGQRLQISGESTSSLGQGTQARIAEKKAADARNKIVQQRDVEAKKLAEAEAILAAKKAADARKLADAKKSAGTAKVANGLNSAKDKDANEKKLAGVTKPVDSVKTAEIKKVEVKKIDTTTAKASPKAATSSDDNVELDVGSLPANKPVETASAGPEFRWPVRGRIIQGFGQSSDGINISVPEGTAVRAAEDGTVAYAGSELKGYGNLVLIRHANGYVTAYGHAKDIAVKRGQIIKRGQVLGTSGSTGDVSAPQLLFEIRKDATPVDPRRYLTAG